MHPDLKLTIDLQTVDREVARLSAEVAYLPRHIQEIESKLDGAQRQLEADRKALAANQSERRKLEGEIPPLQQKASKYKDQVFEVKTNEQYRALQHEIEFAESEIRKIEDQILERMVAVEELDSRMKKAEKQLAAERAEGDKEKAEATARTQADQEALAELQQRRDEYRKLLSPALVRAYDALARTRKGVAVAEVRDGSCGGCNVRLRPQAFQEVKANESIRQCEACNRILYYVSPPVAEEPQAASEAPNAG
jgi:predicted  nucleic acid-binding Zn-ribbon protein